MSAKYGLPETITAQTLFDKVATHLLTQGRPSIVDDHPPLGNGAPFCAYRGDSETACAVGCLISDERYESALEGSTVFGSKFRQRFPELVPHRSLLSTLQNEHDHLIGRKDDGTFVRENVIERLTEVARIYDLSPIVLTA